MIDMPLEIAFHGLPSSPALRDAIIDRVAKLQRLAPHGSALRVTVEQDSRSHHQGNTYRVHARLIVPGGELDAGRSPPGGATHDDPYVAVRDTFDTLTKRLEGHAQRRRHEVKSHDSEAHRGHILELYPDTGYGVIKSDDGREIQFHRTSLTRSNPIPPEAGREVEFTEIHGSDGPWAASVYVGDRKPGHA